MQRADDLSRRDFLVASLAVGAGVSRAPAVAPRPGTEPSAQELSDLVAAELGPFTRPRHVVFVEGLPRNAAGKVVKDDLRRLVAAEPDRLGERLRAR